MPREGEGDAAAASALLLLLFGCGAGGAGASAGGGARPHEEQGRDREERGRDGEDAQGAAGAVLGEQRARQERHAGADAALAGPHGAVREALALGEPLVEAQRRGAEQ